MTTESRRAHSDQRRPILAGRGRIGAALGLAGAALSFLGWYGVSGRATIAEQMPYLASGSIPGAALVVAAAIVLASESTQRSTQRTDALVAELHALLTEESLASPEAVVVETSQPPDMLVAVPDGQHYHRTRCELVVGKSGVEALDAAAIERRALSACPVCEPDRPEP